MTPPLTSSNRHVPVAGADGPRHIRWDLRDLTGSVHVPRQASTGSTRSPGGTGEASRSLAWLHSLCVSLRVHGWRWKPWLTSKAT